MTRLVHDAATFAEQSISGFAQLHPGYVRRVDGGVVRATPGETGHVAVIIGGGSGHFPAFAGFVGPGLAAGAVCGNIFASPSAGQVCRVARAAESGGGVLLSFGNYAGDALNFGQAEQRLRSEGYDVRTVRVTDDIASAAADDLDRRRGIAGDLTVFKVAGAAADLGWTLDEVERVARRANERTRSIGVAFGGLSLPGASEPLFSVPPGRLAVGMGIHGEPGLEETAVPAPAELADDLVRRLLDELPGDLPGADGARATALLNGLGGMKYEELFVLYDLVSQRLAEAGVTVVLPECGELITSLEMPGVSLTLMWLDDELERLWSLPADTPAYRRTAVSTTVPATDGLPDGLPVGGSNEHGNAERFREVAPYAVEALAAVRDALVEREDELGRLDSVAGDGDHGLGMSRGSIGAADAAQRAEADGGGLVRLLSDAGEAWAEHGGGTSGALWGIALTAGAASLAAVEKLDELAAAGAVQAALDAVMSLGGAEPGDKTLIDAFAPFAAALREEVSDNASLPVAWQRAAVVSTTAATDTADLLPRMGRARPHAEKSLGHPDPGAVSFSLIATTLADQLSAGTRGTQ